jgi:hypothetical protein
MEQSSGQTEWINRFNIPAHKDYLVVDGVGKSAEWPSRQAA